MKKLYVDVETTGVDKSKHGIWQIGAILEIDGQPIDQIVLEMQPHKGKLVSPEALAHSRITLDDLRSFSNPLAAHSDLKTWLRKHISPYNKTDKAVFLAYNAAFDYDFTRRWFEDCGDTYFGSWVWYPYIDILQKAAWALISERVEMENFKLGTVCRYLGIEFDEELAHDAFYDIRKTRELDQLLDERRLCIAA